MLGPQRPSTLAATANDSDGTIASVQFKVGSTVIATDYTAPYACEYTRTSSGTVAFTATATDNEGKQGHKTESITWSAIPYVAPLPEGDRWIKADGDDLWDYVESVVVNQMDENSYESYFYGAPEVGVSGRTGTPLVFHSFGYTEYCYSYYHSIYNYVWDFVWRNWGFFGDRWSWIGSWYSPYYYFDCDYQIHYVASRLEFHGDPSGKRYQIQTKDDVNDPAWANVGGPITGGSTSISRELGVWGGIAHTPEFVRIARLGEAYGSANNPVPVFGDYGSDIDGDGLNDEFIKLAPVVKNVVEGVQDILEIAIPTGVILDTNSGAIGSVIRARVKTIGQIIREEVVEYVLTGESNLGFTIGVATSGDSVLEFELIKKSEPFEVDFHVAGYARDSVTNLLPTNLAIANELTDSQELTTGMQVLINNDDDYKKNVIDSQVFGTESIFLDNDLIPFTVDVGPLKETKGGIVKVYLETPVGKKKSVVRIWKQSNLPRTASNILLDNSQGESTSASLSNAFVGLTNVGFGSSLLEWDLKDNTERQDFLETFINEDELDPNYRNKAFWVEGLVTGEESYFVFEYDFGGDEPYVKKFKFEVHRGRTVIGQKVVSSYGLGVLSTNNLAALGQCESARIKHSAVDVMCGFAFYNPDYSRDVQHSGVNFDDLGTAAEFTTLMAHLLDEGIEVYLVDSLSFYDGPDNNGDGNPDWSFVGVASDNMPMIVRRDATNGTVMHEYGHVIGLDHRCKAGNYMMGRGGYEGGASCDVEPKSRGPYLEQDQVNEFLNSVPVYSF